MSQALTALHWPKISLVTPSYNQAAWIEKTLKSVLGQGYPNLQFGVVDGDSTDGTIEILERYRDQLSFVVIEPDAGMYDAIQKGFQRADGQIMGWLNSDDILLPNALFTLARLFTDVQDAQWLTGSQCVIDEMDGIVALAPARAWSAESFAINHSWIQQESTFWRKDLWHKAGGHLRTDLKLAGDYELWNRFFRAAPLYSADVPLGGFRVRKKGQASLEQMAAYEAEVAQIQLENPWPQQIANRVKKIKQRERIISSLKGIGKDALRTRFINPLMPAPPRIWFDRINQKFTV